MPAWENVCLFCLLPSIARDLRICAECLACGICNECDSIVSACECEDTD